MNFRLMVTTMAVMMALVIPREGATGNGMTELQIPFNITIDYIECLGEGVEIDLEVTARTHFIELQSGRVHYVENWFMEGTASGLSSGFTWFAHGASPFALNAGAAQFSNSLLSNLVFEPLDGGRKFLEKLRLQLVVDANGTVRVEHEPPQFRCANP